VYVKPPADWDETSDEEQGAWIEQVLMVARSADPGPADPE
jgi:hypothetical protein